MSKPANQTTLLQVEVMREIAAGALCSIFKQAYLSPDFAHYARFRAVYALRPGDLVLIPDDGESDCPELRRILPTEFTAFVRGVPIGVGRGTFIFSVGNYS